MMSLIDLDDDQRWVPTHVNVTVLRARGLRTKGKHGSRYLYTIIQVGKEKYTTGLVEKAEVPVWNEECCFELLPGILEDGGRTAYPTGSGDLVFTVMHRVLIGLDVFLGQTIIPLDKIFQDGACPRDEWFKLNSKVGRKEKERGELQVTVQFTRNNMTASMFDLTMKDKPRSAFGKLKDRVTGRKRDVESSSAIVPGRYAALSGSAGQPFGEEGGRMVECKDTEITEEKRGRMKDFFKGRLRKSSDTRSCSSLASESSVSSMASDNLGPPPSLDLLSDPPSSPIYSSKVRVDSHYGEPDLAKKVLTSQHTTKVLTHKRAFSDEASKITTAFPRTNTAVESLKGQTMTQSKSSLCINGSHVYDSEPSTPKSSGTLPSKLVLLEKCSPLSRSLQNLTKKSEDKSSFAEGRRWSFDKLKKEEKEEDKEGQAASAAIQEAHSGGRPAEAAGNITSSAAESPEKGRKLRKTLFSSGRSDSLPAKSDLNQSGSSSEGRFRGWFGSGDSQNKPRLQVSPKIESFSDVPCSLPPRSLVPPQSSLSSHVSPDDSGHINVFTPSSSTSTTPLSPSNPFHPNMQRNPFFDEIVAEESQKSPCLPPDPSSLHYTTSHVQSHSPKNAVEMNATNVVSIKRDRPRPVARQISLPTLSPTGATPNSPNHSAICSTSASAGDWDLFDAFASSRLYSPKSDLLTKQIRTTTSTQKCGDSPVHEDVSNYALETSTEEPPPLPPRKPLRTSVNEIFSDGWLHRGQELAVHKEAYLLSQTGVASLQHGKDIESKRNSIASDPHSSNESSDSVSALTQPHKNITSPGLISDEKFKKFKYEPLEDQTDFWGGMLFEQDLYGRMCRGNYGQPKVQSPLLSLTADENPEKNLDDYSGFSRLFGNPSKRLEISCSPLEDMIGSNPCESPGLNNNISFSLTLGDLNMNINSSDFGFIDSDGSSQSDAVDCTKNVESLDGLVLFDDLPERLCQKETSPEALFALKETYIPTMNSSFEITPSSSKLCKVLPVCQDSCENCQCEPNNVAPEDRRTTNSHEMSTLTPENSARVSLDVASEFRNEQRQSDDDSIKVKENCDDNGNPQEKLAKSNQIQPISGVVSARIKPRGISRQNSSDSPKSQSKNDHEFEQFLSLVQNISEVSEGPLSYQPTKSALSSLKMLDQQPNMLDSSFLTNQTQQNESKVGTGRSEISFKELHAKVAPTCRTPSKTKTGKSLLEPSSSSTHHVPSLSANSLLCNLSILSQSIGKNADFSTSLAVAPYTSSTTFSTDHPLVDARHSLLTEETQPASNLPRQESRPHPVKPLTSSQSEKKDSRSVLEKLKSTINPARSSHQVAAEPEKNQEPAVDRAAQYMHLTNMELISLLLQQEMDMQKQQAANEQQGAQLEKCEAELKKVKLQVRDLEDYIDNLLLRIMEQTPTLLQVRTRHK